MVDAPRVSSSRRIGSVLEDDLSQLICLVINTVCWHVLVEFKISKALKDLLKRRLTDRVVL